MRSPGQVEQGSDRVLVISGLSKAFGALVVVDQLDLDLTRGEALGIIGPNGAGKTTLFNLITGAVRHDQGELEFSGRPISNLSMTARCRAGISRSFQVPQPFTGMTVFENLMVGAEFGANLSAGRAHSKCLEVLEQTGLMDRANDRAGKLTLLERKRLELARALAAEPKLLLLDEIAGGLTEQECQSLIRTIQEIRATGLSIIWIEHIVHALIAVVDRLIVLNFGRKIAEGEPEKVLASPEVRKIYLGIEEGLEDHV